MKKAILFVDDELHIIEALFDVMHAEGYDVETCSSISAAVKKVREREFACVVLDIMIDPGDSYPNVDPSNAGIFAVSEIQKIRSGQSITPDDIGKLGGVGGQARSRARQNVIFEMGYFLGRFGRASGRVMLIESEETELPSDIAGLVRIDGSQSQRQLIADLKLELRALDF
ncbi:MAG: TIR domain-containing protein [Acidobacteriota bacterium]